MHNGNYYFRHMDGGLYLLMCYGTDADSGKTVAIYEHLWPFDRSVWVRDAKEFEARFTRISDSEFDEALKAQSRNDAQAAVNNTKAARRAKRARELEDAGA